MQDKPQNIIDRKEFRKRYKIFMSENAATLQKALKYAHDKTNSFGSIIESQVEQYGDKVLIKFEDKEITYNEYNELVNQYAHYFLSLGVKKGDIVDLIMGNRIEYVVLLGAIAKIGAQGSLINSDLREKSLVHCISITLGKVIVVGEEDYGIHLWKLLPHRVIARDGNGRNHYFEVRIILLNRFQNRYRGNDFPHGDRMKPHGTLPLSLLPYLLWNEAQPL